MLELLEKIDISQADREAVAECVASHEGIVKPKTLEAQVVHDTDVLEKSGILGLIRHTWKLTNSGKINPDKIDFAETNKVADHILWRQSRLQTTEGKKLSQNFSINLPLETISKIVKLSAKLASQGVITEVIAEKLVSVIPEKEYSILKKQLSQEYIYSN